MAKKQAKYSSRAKTTKKVTASKSKKPASPATKNIRRLAIPNYKSFKVTKRIKHYRPPLPAGWRLLGKALGTLKKHWKIFLFISLLYGLLNLTLVHGFSPLADIDSFKNSLESLFEGDNNSGGFSDNVSLLAHTVNAGSSPSGEAGGVYQVLLLVIFSLASIWALRQALANAKFKILDSLYKSSYPLIPFILILFVISLQLLPLLLGSWLYSTLTVNGIAVTVLEKVVWGLLCLSLVMLSLYMICSSLFALYIVTLPSMTPMKALRSARQLVRHRRWEVLRKIMFLPLALIIIGAIIFLPLVSIAPTAVEWVFLALSMFILVIVHGYMYTLYRELL